MPRRSKAELGPSHLSKLLKELQKPPILTLEKLKYLKLTYAFRNDHFGVRHFVKESLPRIRYANPTLAIEVNKPMKAKSDVWGPEMVLRFENGESKTLTLHQKWSSTILRELMDTAGGPAWETWKAERLSAGKPIVEGEETAKKVEGFVRKTSVPMSWEEWKFKKVEQMKAMEMRKVEEERKKKERKEAEEKAAAVELMPERPRPRTGAAAVLP